MFSVRAEVFEVADDSWICRQEHREVDREEASAKDSIDVSPHVRSFKIKSSPSNFCYSLFASMNKRCPNTGNRNKSRSLPAFTTRLIY